AGVRATKANFETAQAYLAYYTAFYARQQALHESHFISDNDFERYGSELTAAKNRVDETRALHEQAILLFDKKKIRAPADGIVIKRNVTEGEPVSYYPPDPFIYTIATDISTLNAEVEIPAGVATHLKIGMEAGLAIAGQQGSRLKSRIAELTESSATNGSGIICRAKLPIHNGKKDLRPGMVVDAKIPLAKPKEVLTIAAEQCTIRPELIRELTRTEGMAYRPLSPEDRARYRGMNDYRIVWVQAGQAFIEKPVKVKALETGDGYEVLEGLSEKDRVVESVTPGKTGK
ncbi:MAG: efflux RND transporter periplasmic adaptor subunit, partial [Candidatus Dependentiae bacterium]|nr:efflux RND transporter periplasmic adaptor subunit [Candidatus Dependentiae bacterium]